MADTGVLTRLAITGYGQVELNQVAFRRDGRIEAQCAIGKEADGTTDIPYLENGMLLKVDKVHKRIDKATNTANTLFGLHYSTEHMYDERKTALKDFKLNRGTFLPRIGFLAPGDRFTTNCLAYMKGETWANDTELKTALAAVGTTPLYGVPCANGAIEIVSGASSNTILLQVVEATTMPDGQFGVKFVVLK